MDLDINQVLEQVENTRSTLTENPTLASPQEKTLSTIIALIEEDDIQRKRHSEAARSRRKAARVLLSIIHERFGCVILFLCSTTVPISKLYKINHRATEFVSKLQSWAGAINISDGIINLAEKRLTPSLLSRLASDEARTTQLKRGVHSASGVAKRPRYEPTAFEHEAIPSYHGVLDLTKRQQSAETPTDNYNDSNNSEDGDDGERSEGSDESDSGEVQAVDTLTDNPRPTLEGEVPLYSNVYELRDMDAIRVIANQGKDLEVRLTVPHFPDARPFITISESKSRGRVLRSEDFAHSALPKAHDFHLLVKAHDHHSLVILPDHI
ncbi:hypothetical protein FDECE_11213 [Fusarium decemcellulare]|nr:hypothetical protein FDECE_11213 [Fusarium decemcellulare]